MKSFFIFIFGLFSMLRANADSFDIHSFLNKPLVINQIENGVVKNSFLGFFKPGPNQNTYISSYVNQFTQNFASACISTVSTTCKYESNYQELFLNQLKINFASKSKALDFLEKIPGTKAIVESEYTKVDNESMNLFVSLNGSKQSFLISKQHVLSGSEFNFLDFDEVQSNRKSLEEVALDDKNLSASVVQISKDFDLNNALYGGAGSSGTGFFISEDGYLLTNHHVISAQNECVVNFHCEVKFKHTLPDGTEKNVQLKVNLLAMSVFHDFALVKVNLNGVLKPIPLKINFSTVGPNLKTLGYPGDKVINNIFKITYSFGHLIGLNSIGVETSTFIFGGASGSPLLLQESNEVVGIMSNGADVNADGTGTTGTARLLSYIDSEYGISKYLTGQKQVKIKAILNAISSAQDEKSITIALNSLSQEKSLYGLPYLKQLLINSNSKMVRKKLIEYLQKESLLAGQSGH